LQIVLPTFDTIGYQQLLHHKASNSTRYEIPHKQSKTLQITMHFYSSFHSTEKNHRHIYISMQIQRKSPQQHKIGRKHANWWQSKPSEDVSNHLKCPTIVTFFITNCSNKLPCLPTAFISSQQRAKIIHNGWYECISSSNSNGRCDPSVNCRGENGGKLKESNWEIIKW
jgi:hypothetical protein